MKKRNIKWLISLTTVLLAIVHLIIPEIKVDFITVTLLALAIIPWIETLFKSVELPGGLKLEFRDLERIGLEAKESGIIQEDTGILPDPVRDDNYYFVELAKSNQALALVSLRIEMEKRLRKIANENEINEGQTSIFRIIDKLTQLTILSHQEKATLRDMINTLNQAAHGVEFDERTAKWIIDNGPRIVYSLDSKLNARGGKFSHENPYSAKHWVDLSFEKQNWTSNLEWSQHISKHLKLWKDELRRLREEILTILKDDPLKLEKFVKADENWSKQINLEHVFLTSIEDLRSKIGREGQMIISTTFMSKHRERAFELEEILKLLK